MRKFATVEEPVELVRAAYLDLENWHQWRPGIKRIKVLDRSENRVRAIITQRMAGRYHNLEMEFELREDGFRERQIRGWLKTWVANWSFQPDPSGTGTAISMDVDLEMGLIGLLISRRTVAGIVDRMFKETAALAGKRVQGSAPSEPAAVATLRQPCQRIRIYRTETGLEVWLDDKRYLALPADS